VRIAQAHLHEMGAKPSGWTMSPVMWRPNGEPQKGPCTKAGAGLSIEWFTSSNPLGAT
jgi:hypothetical protein